MVNCGTQGVPAADLKLDFTYRRVHYQSSGTPTCDDVTVSPTLTYFPASGGAAAYWQADNYFIPDYPTYKHFDESGNLVLTTGVYPDTGYHRFKLSCVFDSFFGLSWVINHLAYENPSDPFYNGNNFSVRSYTQSPFYMDFSIGAPACPSTNTIPANTYWGVRMILTQA